MLKILYLLLMAIYVFYLPGYLMIRAGHKNSDCLSRYILAFALGTVLVPIFSFAIAILLHTTVQNNLLLITATFINLICLIVLFKRKSKACTS
ncbi:MAG: hypothetical protein JW867_02040 [Candidatus Omnitrophica bacterium]|nr:hypothetical protein [Candidatus Omnitrophota bacterium]